ncbi:Lrp/AsnC family transcriptional regulator [Aminobacter sp. SR38]|jgi:Lrp/AsnC family leucine-responsive transcriptional regulator|uniref:Lrp/AsnC family transcriptional regulator n=1 Tax=Aminobacter sp. SR38 TaxID=2774562 RepID=UPI0017851202|nr:Lrp/AsnC family transcriptional regulator [Aminobacter sp. SR38]QOF70943.1 Lrp/AsnC family transcriptional regulator [Aminobacter sp. SR38]
MTGTQPNSRSAVPLDELDRRILAALQQDNRLSFAELAERVASSAASCMRRVKRLRDAGVIIADVSILDPVAVGKSLTAVVNIDLEAEQRDLVEAFKRQMRAAPEVTQCYMVTGGADFVVIVNVEDIDAYEAFTRKWLYSNPNIRKFRSMIMLDRVKFEPRVAV